MAKQNEVGKLDLLKVNYQELDERVELAIQGYRNIIITEDNLDEIAKGKAAINKVIKEINAERIAIDKEWKKPLAELKKNYDERIKRAETVVDYLADGLNEFQTKRWKEIEEEVKSIYAEYEIKEVPLYELFELSWYNKTVDHEVECRNKFKRVQNDLKHLSEYDAETRALALNNYKATKDIVQALSEAKKLKEAIASFKPPVSLKADQDVQSEFDIPEHELIISFRTIEDFEQAVAALDELEISYMI